MRPPMYGNGAIGTVTNGDKLLCNRCPLKHEVREVERGVKCFTRTHKNTYIELPPRICVKRHD